MALTGWLMLPTLMVARIVFPLAMNDEASRVARGLRWLLHSLVWGGVFALLWAMAGTVQVERFLRSPTPSWHSFWMLLLAGTVYAASWFTIGLWHALRTDLLTEPDSEFDALWAEAVATLEHAKICPATTPTFLVLGSISSAVHGMFRLWGVRATSPRTSLPFQVFANHDAVFVAVEQMGALPTSNHRTDRFATAIGDPSERFATLCRLIASRCQTPGLQGVVITLPWDALGNESATRNGVAACQTDLETIRTTFGVDVPIYFTITVNDATHSGLARRLTAFQPIPPTPDLDPADIVSMWKTSVEHLFLETLPSQMMSLAGGTEKIDGRVLFDAVSDLTTRRHRLTQLLAEGTRQADGEAGMVAGLCLMSNFKDNDRAADAAKSLWSNLLSYAPTATWSSQAIASAESSARYHRFGYSLAVITVVAAFAVVIGVLAMRD